MTGNKLVPRRGENELEPRPQNKIIHFNPKSAKFKSEKKNLEFHFAKLSKTNNTT